MDILNNIKSKLIVSCQPVVGGVLDNERSVLALAEASVNGGATALRINDKKNVYNVKNKWGFKTSPSAAEALKD